MSYKDWVCEESWNDRFELQLDMFLEQVADTNLRIFMGMHKESDMKPLNNRVTRTRLVRNQVHDEMLNAV